LSALVGLGQQIRRRSRWGHEQANGVSRVGRISVETYLVLLNQRRVVLEHDFAKHVAVANVLVLGQVGRINVAALVELSTKLDDDIEGMIGQRGQGVLEQQLRRIGGAGLRLAGWDPTSVA
jgi:hypothetical protein